MITQQEWDALPEEERARRIEKFKSECAKILAPYDKAAQIEVLDRVLSATQEEG